MGRVRMREMCEMWGCEHVCRVRMREVCEMGEVSIGRCGRWKR